MNRLLFVPLALIAIALPRPAFAAEPEFFFNRNDRIVFLGDSITEQYQYSTYIELYLTTRFPDGELDVPQRRHRRRHRQRRGRPLPEPRPGREADGRHHQLRHERRRLRQVQPEPPTRSTSSKTEEMLKMAKNAGVRVALLSPNAVDRAEQDATATSTSRRRSSSTPRSRASPTKYGLRVRRSVRHHPGRDRQDGEGRPEGQEGRAVLRRLPHRRPRAGC